MSKHTDGPWTVGYYVPTPSFARVAEHVLFDIADALRVVERMQELGWFWRFRQWRAMDGSLGWDAGLHRENEWRNRCLKKAPTLPEAICRAALASVAALGEMP